jgi:hypothetical protein
MVMIQLAVVAAHVPHQIASRGIRHRSKLSDRGAGIMPTQTSAVDTALVTPRIFQLARSLGLACAALLPAAGALAQPSTSPILTACGSCHTMAIDTGVDEEFPPGAVYVYDLEAEEKDKDH